MSPLRQSRVGIPNPWRRLFGTIQFWVTVGPIPDSPLSLNSILPCPLPGTYPVYTTQGCPLMGGSAQLGEASTGDLGDLELIWLIGQRQRNQVVWVELLVLTSPSLTIASSGASSTTTIGDNQGSRVRLGPLRADSLASRGGDPGHMP